MTGPDPRRLSPWSRQPAVQPTLMLTLSSDCAAPPAVDRGAMALLV